MSQVRGLVRPIVTLAFTGAVIIGFFLGRIPPDSFLPVASAAIMFWFAQRRAADGE